MSTTYPNQGGLSPDQAALIADLEARFRPSRLPVAVECRDLTKEGTETLQNYGVPPRPEGNQPRLYNLWTATFGREMNFIPFVFSVERLLAEQYEPSFPQTSYGTEPVPRTSFGPGSISFSGSRFGSSRNWSGAYAEANGGKTFVQLWGQFAVPTPTPPPGAQLPATGKTTEYHCATWIGLDGQRRYRNSSLPQIGTHQSVSVAADGSQTPTTEAWVQWWARNDDGNVNGIGPVPIPNNIFPVNHGDQIVCVLTVVNTYNVLLNIINVTPTTPNFMAIEVQAPTATPPGGASLQYSISGATAEWIMERPMDLITKELEKFPDYGSTDFVNCVAVEAAKGGPLVVRDLISPRFIRMYDIRFNPLHTAWISMPKQIDNESFSLTYV